MVKNQQQNPFDKCRELFESIQMAKYLYGSKMQLSLSFDDDIQMIHIDWSEDIFQAAQAALVGYIAKIGYQTTYDKLRMGIVRIVEYIWGNYSNARLSIIENENNFIFVAKNILTSKYNNELTHDVIESIKSTIKNHSLIFPIDGINMKIKELSLPLFTLREYKGSDIQKMINQKRARDRITKALENTGVYILVNQTGDSEYSYNCSIEIADFAKHILNFYLGHTYNRQSLYKKISVLPRNSSTNFVYGILSEDRNTFHEEIHPYKNHLIREEDVDSWIQNRLQEITGCFNAKKGISYRVKNSVIWYSKGIDADTIEEQFLCLAIALEILLGDRGSASNLDSSWGSITQKLSERCAFILGSDLQVRRKIAKIVKELYGIRSGIVHEGKKSDIGKLLEMDDIVWQCIIYVVGEFQDESKMFEWFEDQKFLLPKK